MDTNPSKLDTSHLASADIADKILENYEEGAASSRANQLFINHQH